MIGLVSTILAIYYFWETTKRYLSIFLIFFLVTGGFQLIPVELMLLPALGISKYYDWALLYVAIITLINPEILFNLRVWGDKNGLTYLGGTLLILLLYSLLYVEVEPLIALRVFRNHIFFILLLPMVQLSRDDFIKVFRLIVYFTTFASALYCLQPFLGRGILSGAPSDVSAVETGLSRFYNMPFYIMPVLFALFIRKSYLRLKFHYLLFFINAFAIIVSQHRNMLISIFCCYLLYLLLLNKLQIKRIVLISLIGGGVFYGVDSYFNNKFSSGLVELTQLTTDVTPLIIYSSNSADISTSEFRRLHFIERYNYVKEDLVTFLFGIGFLTEDAALVKKLNFNIGLTTDTKEVLQVESSDIAWSLLILRFGTVGILAFLYFYLSYVKLLYKMRNETLCVVGILYVTTLFTNSFFGVDILSPHAFCLLMLIGGFYYSLLNKSVSNPELINNTGASVEPTINL